MPDPENKLGLSQAQEAGYGRPWYQLVQHFNEQNGYYPPEHPRHPSSAVKVLRLRLMMEELGELSIAMHEDNMVEVADGLCDLLYVVLGAAVEYGLGPVLEQLFSEVHRSNMTKFQGKEVQAFEAGLHPEIPGEPASDRVNDKYSDKVQKGGIYDPPQIARILDEFWRRFNKKLERP